MNDLRPRLPSFAHDAIVQFLRAHLAGPPEHRAVVGLSGGIDSALVARLCVEAVGAPRVLGVLLPGDGYPPALLEETRQFAANLQLPIRVVPVGPILGAFRAAVPDAADPVGVGNVAARLRMTALYAEARSVGGLVVGTGNKSELLLGYFTKYGDGGVDLLPIGDLYKTQVRELAVEVGIPAPVLQRAPSAGFWDGQTDEGELGAPYESIDAVLRGMEELLPAGAIAERTGLPIALVNALEARVAQNRHKRRPVPVPKLALRTVGLDWRD